MRKEMVNFSDIFAMRCKLNRHSSSVVFLVFLCYLTCIARSNQNDVSFDMNRIVNGLDVPSGKYPFQVSLQNLRGEHVCGGTILNANTVLTAGHCVPPGAAIPQNILIITSTTDLRTNKRIYKVARIIRHSGFIDKEKPTKVILNDIALLKITTKFALKNGEGVVKLPRRGLKLNGGEIVTAIGWGQTGTVVSPKILQEAAMQVVNDVTCDNKYYGSTHVVTPQQHVCAVGGNKGPCMGDSGGPLLLQSTGEQVGIVSFGALPCGPGPTIFAELAYYLDWIQANMAG